MARPSRVRTIARAATIILVGVYLGSGLVIRQWFGVKKVGGHSLRSLPVWVMFGGAGLKVTQVRFVERTASGDRRELDRFEQLELDRLQQPAGVWRVRGTKAAHALGRRLCDTIDPESTLELTRRTATRRGWTSNDDRPDILCRPGSRRGVR